MRKNHVPAAAPWLTVVTGLDSVAISHMRPGAPFRDTANVRFDAHSGSGTHNERRACTLAFTKQ
jgi:hypothetical protein